MNIFQTYIHDRSSRTKYLLALAGFLVMIGIFASFADEVHEGDTLAFDKSVLSTIRASFATPQLDSFMSVVTDIGGTEIIGLVTLGLIAYFLYRQAYSRALLTILTMGGVALGVTFLKLIFGRERPDIANRVVDEHTFSFPSGHAMGSAGLALLIIVLMWQTKWRWPTVVFAVAYVLFVGFSRLYLNVHYPTDVLAGWLLAAGWVTTLYFVLRTNKRLHI